jgi:hypothetical protein
MWVVWEHLSEVVAFFPVISRLRQFFPVSVARKFPVAMPAVRARGYLKPLIERALFPNSALISRPDAGFVAGIFPVEPGNMRAPATGKRGARKRPFS